MRIKEVLKSKDKTQQELADLLGISLSAVKQMVNASSLTTATVEKIAVALGVPVWQLFASPEEVASGDAQSDFVAFVRSGGKNFTFTDKEELRDFANGLCGETKRPDHANIRGKEYFQLK